MSLQKLKSDPIVFGEYILNFKPFNYQVNLLRDNSDRIVGCWGRQTGKTSTIAVKSIYYVYCNPNVTVLITSPSLRQSMIMFDRVLSYIYSSKISTRSVTRKTRTIIELSNGSKIVALPCSEKYLRGYTANLIICDETAFMPENVIVNIIFPMLATTKGKAVFLSTPWGKDHFFYRAFINPQYSVHRVKSSECPLITKEFLEEQRQNMTREAFQREYEVVFVEDVRAYFSQDLIRQCIDPDLESISSIETEIPKGEYYVGVDFGKLQDYSVVCVLRKIEDNFELIHLYEFPLETPYTNVIGYLQRLYSKIQFRYLLVDQTGVGEPILEELRNSGIPSVEGLTFTVKTKEELLSALKIIMEQKRLKLPYHRRLCEQINDQQYEYSKSGHLTFSHPPNTHDDMLWSLALSYSAYFGRGGVGGSLRRGY